MDAELGKFIAALFAIMNPATAIPVFLAVTEGDKTEKRRRIAISAGVAVAVILTISAFAGKPLLALFGISLASFEGAGGIIILLMALSMLKAEPSKVHHSPEEAKEGSETANPAIFPIAIPLLAGPGAISTVILFGDRLHGVGGYSIIIGGIFVMSIVLAISLAMAPILAKVLGKTGMNVVSRIMGMILAAIAVEMIASAFAKLWSGLAT